MLAIIAAGQYIDKMSTILAFLLTSLQGLAVIIGYIKPYPDLFDTLITYGSPPALFRGILSHDVAFSNASILLPSLLLFHAIKYLCLARSQFLSDRPTLHYLAVFFELGYLATSIRFLF